MPFCQRCGEQLTEVQDVCLNCGTAVKKTNTASYQPPDTGGFGWGLLGFCIPIVGLILFLVWSRDRPNTAKAAGLGALISVLAYVFIWIIAFIISAGSML